MAGQGLPVLLQRRCRQDPGATGDLLLDAGLPPDVEGVDDDADLVRGDVVEHRGGREDETPGEHEIALHRAGAPARAGVPHRHPRAEAYPVGRDLREHRLGHLSGGVTGEQLLVAPVRLRRVAVAPWAVPVPLTEPVILAQTGWDYTALLAALNTHTKETP